MNNSRFPVSLHILTLLEQMKGEHVSSDLIAGSININPVLVRKEIINLRKHGFVESREGKGGGTILAKSSADIHLSDVYLAVKDKSLLGETKNEPNPKCAVGRQINTHLKDLYREVEDTLLKSLGNQTLADFAGKFK